MTKVTLDCIKKHFHYIFMLTKEPVTITYKDTSWTIEPERFKISPKFFRTYRCKGCGQCCKSKRSIIFDANQFNHNNSILQETCIEDAITINDKEYKIYRSIEGSPCPYLDPNTKNCIIYPDRPVLSRMPHIFFDKNTKSGNLITQRQYRRNWRLQCQSVEEGFDIEFFETVTLPTLEYLQDCIQHYEIPSHIQNVIDTIKDYAHSRLLLRS